MRIESHKFKKQDGSIEADFTFSDQVYMNATEQYQIFGKEQTAFSNYKDRVLVPYAEKLIELGKVPTSQNVVVGNNQQLTLDELIVVRKGGNNPLLRGTWIHPKLEIVFSRWLDDEFAIWCDEKIAELLSNGIVTLLPEDQKWVDLVEGLSDRKPASALFLSDIREILLIHEIEGYNIKAFTDLLTVVRDVTPREDQAKTFKKIRELIKEMYESGELSRTSHEQMLELCTVTVVEVLEKEIKHERRLRRRFELKATTPVEPIEPTMSQLAAKAQAEHNNAIAAADAVIDAQSLYAHKVFGLSRTSNDVVPVYPFGAKCSVADCKYLIAQDGYKVVFSNTLYKKAFDATDKSPDLQYKEFTTSNKIAIWFNDDSTASCKVQKSYRLDNGEWKNKSLLDIRLISMTSTDPSLYTGTNLEGTIRVMISTLSNHFIIYGNPE